jgi:hypothetical protein
MRDLLGGTEDPAAIRGKVECDAGDVAAMPSGAMVQAMPGEASWRWQLARTAVARSRVAGATDDPGHAHATTRR